MPAVWTAARASSTAPGPTGIPAPRSARRGGSEPYCLQVGRPAPTLFRGPQLRAHLIDQLLGFAAFEPDDVVLIFEQDAERVGDSAGIERHDIELGKRGRPVEGLGYARRLEQILLAQCLHKEHH